jgi:hypothetical protein
MPEFGATKSEPFGKKNRRPAQKLAPKRKPSKAERPPAGSSRKLYFYLAGGVLFLVFAGFAFA